MKCPKCGSDFKVTHVFSAGEGGQTRRLQCTNDRCNVVGTLQSMLVNINPERGQGAYMLAKKMRGTKGSGGAGDLRSRGGPPEPNGR